MANTNADFINAIRAEMKTEYASRIPTATNSNLNAIAGALGAHSETANAFLNQLVNKICKQVIDNKRFKNPLEILKKGTIQVGKDIEHIMANPAVSREYSLTQNDLLASHVPDIKSLYYTVNSERQYPATVTKPKLMQAVMTEGGLNELVNLIVGSLYNGDQIDEFLLTKQLVNIAHNSKHLKVVEFDFDVATMTTAQSTEFLKAIKLHSSQMSFPSSAYNSYDAIKASVEKSAITWSVKDDQVILIDASICVNMDVDVLANSFNLDKAEFLAKKIEIDTFGDSGIFAILCDKSWFQIRDSHISLENFYDPSKMTFNYYYNHWQQFAYCLFSNAIIFKKKPVAGV